MFVCLFGDYGGSLFVFVLFQFQFQFQFQFL